MKTIHKTRAIEIISKSNNAKVSFNVPVKDNFSNTYDILIHECNSALTKKLIKEGYSLSMNNKGLEIDKF